MKKEEIIEKKEEGKKKNAEEKEKEMDEDEKMNALGKALQKQSFLDKEEAVNRFYMYIMNHLSQGQ